MSKTVTVKPLKKRKKEISMEEQKEKQKQEEIRKKQEEERRKQAEELKVKNETLRKIHHYHQLCLQWQQYSPIFESNPNSEGNILRAPTVQEKNRSTSAPIAPKEWVSPGVSESNSASVNNPILFNPLVPTVTEICTLDEKSQWFTRGRYQGIWVRHGKQPPYRYEWMRVSGFGNLLFSKPEMTDSENFDKELRFKNRDVFAHSTNDMKWIVFESPPMMHTYCKFSCTTGCYQWHHLARLAQKDDFITLLPTVTKRYRDLLVCK